MYNNKITINYNINYFIKLNNYQIPMFRIFQTLKAFSLSNNRKRTNNTILLNIL